MKEIRLKKGYIAIVDDEDYLTVVRYNWHPNAFGYAYRIIIVAGKPKKQLMHRFINKTPPGFQTDHINHNPLDNRKSNLRTVTPSQNQHNQKPSKKNTSGFVGVHFYKPLQKWVAYTKIEGKRKHIGYFSTAEEASKAFNTFIKKIA